MSITTWPVCPRCEQPYCLIVGLPVVVSRAMAHLVEFSLDASEAAEGVHDTSATIGCGCETQDDDYVPPTDAAVDALEQAIEEAWRASRPGVTAVVNRADGT